MEKKQIAFFLPGREAGPVGGYKIVYEYANRFAEAGYKVSIIYPYLLADDGKLRLNPLFRFKRWLGFYYRRWRGHYKVAEWFNLDNCIQKTLIFKFTTRSTKDFSQYKVVATALRTAYELAEVKSIPETNKYYFIQDFEAWGVSDDVVYESYRLPLKKITIAPWLQERVRKVGQDAVLIPNGFDFEYFKLTNPIENRCPADVALLYHKDDRKRCVDSMAALEIVKRQIPELHVTMFGTPEKPDNLPDWYTYHQCPDKETHNEIYNNAAVFVAASKAEGMALPPAEAMVCGAAIGTVCAESIVTLVQIVYVRKIIITKVFLVSFLESIFASFVMMFCVGLILKMVENLLLQLTVSFVVGMLVYAAILLVCRNHYFLEYLGKVLQKLKINAG